MYHNLGHNMYYREICVYNTVLYIYMPVAMLRIRQTAWRMALKNLTYIDDYRT